MYDEPWNSMVLSSANGDIDNLLELMQEDNDWIYLGKDNKFDKKIVALRPRLKF